jgi:uncharacterized protein (TIGR02145 family)
MKFLKFLAVSAAIALTACGDDNVAAFDEPPMSSQDVSSQDPSSQGKSSSSSEAAVTSSSSDANATSSSSDAVLGSSSSKTGPKMISNGSIITDGQVVDLRDGKTYKTTVIGNQVWMAENLKLDVTQFVEDGLYNNENSFYEALWLSNEYEEISDTNEHFYPWNIAIDGAGIYGTQAKGCGIDSTCHLTGTIRGICPEGFHIPSPTEAEQLIRAIGGKCRTAQKLKAKNSGWEINDGTDEFGFAALPAGYYAVWWGDGMDGFTFEYERIPQVKFLTTSDTLTWSIATEATYDSGVREVYEVVAVYEEFHGSMSSLRCVRDEPAGVNWVDPPLPTAPALPEFEYGEFTDERDGQTYKTVVVNGKTWMDQNLNYVFDAVDTNASCKVFYEDEDEECEKSSDYSCKHPFVGSPVSCKNKYSIDAAYCNENEAVCKNYGKFYTWNQALKACPTGWHLPDNDEIDDFLESINPYTVYDGECLLRHTRFNKIEDSDLNKLLSKDFGLKNFQMNFWTSTVANFNDNYVYTSGYASLKTEMQNIRCVKD